MPDLPCLAVCDNTRGQLPLPLSHTVRYAVRATGHGPEHDEDRGKHLFAQKPANDEFRIGATPGTGGNDIAVGLYDGSTESGIGRWDIG
jgi:hypothetical protein